jgi:hypothetical protein
MTILLTALTQIGGLIYLVSILVFRKQKRRKYLFFLGIYLLATYFLVPYLAPYFGREKIKTSQIVRAHSFFYQITNRNYVKPEMNQLLLEVAQEFTKVYPNGSINCLDANFPFINRFPLLPHLSHSDGKKLDISLIYQTNGIVVNQQPSVSGYGVFEAPKPSESNQIKKCIARDNWQYDFSKYLSFGRINKSVKFSENGTKKLLQIILKHPSIEKVFIEPHLKYRMGIEHLKLRFHGCKAVRHDDHIHLQIN